MIRFPEHENPVASVIIVGWRDAPLLLQCLDSVAEHVTDVPYEVLIVLNEPSARLTAQVGREVIGARVIRFRANLGFGGAVNYAATKARGEFVALLNDDSTVERGWLETLVETARRRIRCGLVGGTFLHPDGTLQEAGSILWSDGHTNAVGDGEAAGYMSFERRVDYCSGGSLLIRKDVWDQLGGFDDRYYPAYYEDVDLALRAADLGWESWYQPLSVVRHARSSSAGRLRLFLDDLTGAEFRQRWAKRLESQPDKWEYERAIWQAMGKPVRVLWLDDHLADRGMGAGFPRMHDTLSTITGDDGIHVDLYASEPNPRSAADLVHIGVRVISDLPAHLAQEGITYDLVVVSRPNNFENYVRLVRPQLPAAKVIYDAEALFYRRLDGQIALCDDDRERARLVAESIKMRRLEESIFRAADAIVCISDAEADAVRAVTDVAVHLVEPWLALPAPTTGGFDERFDIGLVAGWGAGPGSPNCDGLLWFAREVLPRVRAALPGWRLIVTGADPPTDVAWLDGRAVSFVGHVRDLGDFYNSVRVVVSPTRFGAGVKNKTVEAIQYGVPIVATEEAVDGINPTVREVVNYSNDPDRFADAVIALASKRDLWQRARQDGLDALGLVAAERSTGERWLSVIRDTLARPGGAEGER